MTAASPKSVCPAPEAIDRQLRTYRELLERYKAAKSLAVELENQVEIHAEIIKDLVTKYGSSHAEKSKLLHGLQYEAMCTYSQYASIDAAAVETFREALRKSDQSRLLSKVFEKTIRWTLKSEASEIVRGSKLTTKLQALWAKCIVLKDRNPSLQVREKEA